MRWINLRQMALSIVPDMRLRPFGDSGALVALSFSAMEQYYQDQGRDWERYAMIKGRILGADEQDPNVKTCSNYFAPLCIDAILILV